MMQYCYKILNFHHIFFDGMSKGQIKRIKFRGNYNSQTATIEEKIDAKGKDRLPEFHLTF